MTRGGGAVPASRTGWQAASETAMAARQLRQGAAGHRKPAYSAAIGAAARALAAALSSAISVLARAIGFTR
jgi:hypothetical protein